MNHRVTTLLSLALAAQAGAAEFRLEVTDAATGRPVAARVYVENTETGSRHFVRAVDSGGDRKTATERQDYYWKMLAGRWRWPTAELKEWRREWRVGDEGLRDAFFDVERFRGEITGGARTGNGVVAGEDEAAPSVLGRLRCPPYLLFRRARNSTVSAELWVMGPRFLPRVSGCGGVESGFVFPGFLRSLGL